MAVSANVHARDRTSVRLRPASSGENEMPRVHRPVIGRVHTYSLLRALIESDGGRLHYTVLAHKVSVEAGRSVSGLNILLHDLGEEGHVKKLENDDGYQITDSGRAVFAALEAVRSLQPAGSTRKGGVGVR